MGHTGAVLCVDADRDTNHVLTGSADNSCHPWDCETGKQLALLRPTQLPEPVTLTLGTTPSCSPQTSRRDNQCCGSFLDLRVPSQINSNKPYMKIPCNDSLVVSGDFWGSASSQAMKSSTGIVPSLERG